MVRTVHVAKLGGKLPPSTFRLAIPPGINCTVSAPSYTVDPRLI